MGSCARRGQWCQNAGLWEPTGQLYEEEHLDQLADTDSEHVELVAEGLKATQPEMLFSPLALPDIELTAAKNGKEKQLRVTLKGVALFDRKGVAIGDFWPDINAINSMATERLGYPTQKPVALLERIIGASSRPGEIVLDPFCGCGTAVYAAQKLGREWIGIDITHLAISLNEKRLNDAFPGIKYQVHGTPKDLDGAKTLAAQDKYQFQWWAVSLVNAVPYAGKKKGADGGIDGLIYFKSDSKTTERAVVSVKGGDNVNVGMLRDLKGVMGREKAPVGIFITLAPTTKPMVAEAASAGFFDCDFGRFERLQVFTVAELLKGAKPKLPLVDQSVAFRGPDARAQGKLL
jgi:DNA methylase/Restriction endonuclease